MIHYGNNQEQEAVDATTDAKIATPVQIEQLIKQYKTHQCALDFDGAFISINSEDGRRGRTKVRKFLWDALCLVVSTKSFYIK